MNTLKIRYLRNSTSKKTIKCSKSMDRSVDVYLSYGTELKQLLRKALFAKSVILKLFLLWFFCLVISNQVMGSPADSTRTVIEKDIEDLVDHFESDNVTSEMESALNLLEDLVDNPVNINRATVAQLAGIPSLSLRLAKEIVSYRNQVRPFEQTSDLTEVRGIGPVTLKRIQPYVTVGSASQLSRDLYLNRNYWLADGKFEVINRFQRVIQTREGYTRPLEEGGFAGSPYRIYQRLRYQSDHLSINLTQEKDPGESLKKPTGFDFNSWHIEASEIGRLRSLVVGDYNLQFGQGLVMWRSSSFGKSLHATGASIRNETGVRPYTSSQETNFFRGAALSYGNRVQTTLFYSQRRLSASPLQNGTVRFPSSTGYHRTSTEISRRFNTGQRAMGGRIRAELPIGFIGISGYHSVFQKPVQRGDQPWQTYDFQGRHASAISIDYHFLAGPATLFGEAARSRNGAFGFITGLATEAFFDTDLILVYRNYKKRFISIFGSAFGEQSGMPRNEMGLYLSLQHNLSNQFSLRGYIDKYHFPSPRYLMEKPSGGYDLAFIAEYSPSSMFEAYVQLRRDTADDEYEAENIYGQTELLTGRNHKLNIRVHMQYYINPDIRLRNRLEWVQSQQVEEENESGWLVYQDFRFTPGNTLTIDSRITWFQTEGYNSRIYSFENDLLYVFSNNALFDKGLSLYLLLGWRPSQRVQFWFKISTTNYLNRETLGSGRSSIDGNRQTKAGFQMRITL